MTKLLVCLPLLFVACKKEAPKSPPPTTGTGAQFQIDVTENGFEPGNITVPAGTPVKIVFERKTDQTCAKQIVLDTGDGKKVEKDLPLDTPVEIATTFPKAGQLTYACGMNMMKGTIIVAAQ